MNIRFFNQGGEILGPGTDLVIALLGVLLMTVAINAKIHEEEMEYLTQIREQQLEIIHDIANSYPNSKLDSITRDSFQIFIEQRNLSPDITIQNDISLQRISFGDQILFDSGASTLKYEGRKALRKAGKAVKNKIDYIEEILIQGHTDTDGKRDENLDLGSKRAINVFKFLADDVEIKPSENLMSATTFGYYKPINRKLSDKTFNQRKINNANLNNRLKDKNRRIDIVLNYREKNTSKKQ